MPSNRPTTETHALPPTPALDGLLARLGARVTRLVWMHGLGTAVALGLAWLLFAFLLDWWLHLPSAIRVIHLLVLLGIPTFVVARGLVAPLRRRPDRAGLAVLLERAHPGSSELLVSAVQFQGTPAPSGDPALVRAVVAEAEARARGLDADRVLDPRRPRRRALGGIACVALALFVSGWFPDESRVFWARLAGGGPAWPQRTYLAIEIPVAQTADANPSSAPPGSGSDMVVKVARGSDVPVIVRAQGVVPEEVVLHFGDGHRTVLASAGGPTFRLVLRSVQEDTVFHATGGDDTDEQPSARLVVLQPPDVAGLAVSIEPPSYSGLPARTEFDRDVEVLAGSRVAVHVLCEPESARGVARLLPEDRAVPLEPAPFPSSAQELAAGQAARAGFVFRVAPQKSLRYRFELTDDTGLANPEPGTFGISVIEDRAPEVEVLAPGRGDVDTIPSGLLALRVRVEDDFGIARISALVERVSAEGKSEGSVRELTPTPIAPEARAESSDPGSKPATPSRASVVRAIAMARARVEIASALGAEPVVEGMQFQIQVVAQDNCAPAPREGKAAPVRVRVVTTDEFLRRLQDRMSRAQTSATALGELQREKNRRAEELLAVLESDSPDGATNEVSAAATGQRRVLGDARALAREIAAAAESVLYARVDERAGAALEWLDARQADAATRAFDPAPWRELAALSRDRQLAGTGLAGKLVDIVGLALEISEDAAGPAADDLARASETVDLPKVHDHVGRAAQSQRRALAKIDALLERLAEWDNFQSVLALTRDILNGQKSLSERTRQAAKEK